MEVSTDSALDTVRAQRYRWLALIENEKAVADLLNQFAGEAELGVLVAGDRRGRPSPPPNFVSAYEAKDENEERFVREAAANLILEATVRV